MQNSASAGGGLLIGSRAEIFPSEPLPDLNSAGGPAFVARFQGDSSSNLMGVLCNTGLPTRLDSVASMRSIDHPGILRMMDNGVVLWPHDNVRYMAYAFQRPLAPRLAQNINQTYPAMSEDAINHYFVTPMIGILVELLRAGVVHNALNPMNIFWRIGGSTTPQLGECLSGPAGLGQPVLFEPIERAMCLPLGRGVGSHFDDCYAFGVTLALIIIGQNPFKDVDDQTIIQTKLEKGSFNSLIGNRRFSPTHIELLRGLLADDANQRWSADDLEQWQSGRRLTPKNTDAGRRASRSIEFGGKEYWQTRPLMIGLSNKVSDAVKIIEDGTLDKWLRRALGDNENANNLEEAQRSLKESGKTANYEEQLLARTCIALDSSAPIRYRGLVVMPTGIATLIVEAILSGSNIQAISEIISSQLVTFWIEMQKEGKTELVSLGQTFERMRSLIEKTTFGNGLERVSYELNPGLPCLSPFLRTQYVSNPKSLLSALEHVSASANRPREPIDRHLAAFLIVRDRRSEILFEAMVSPETSPRRGLAMLTLFSEMQYRYGPDSLPGLAQWLLPFLEPSVNRFLGKSLKEKLRSTLKETAARGDLGALLQLIDDPKRIERDQQDFMAARMLYLNTLKEIASIEHKLSNRNLIIQSTGKPMAATISSLIAIIFIFLAIGRAAWQGFLQ